MTLVSDSDTIESGIERDRASLASTLGALQDRVSVDHLAKEALGMIRSNAAAYSRSIDSAVRANPLALALTGVGIAWLIFGGKQPAANPSRTAINRWEDEGGTPIDYASRGATGQVDPPGDNWSGDMDSLRQRASATLRDIEKDAQRYSDDVKSGLADQLGSVRDFAAERAKLLADFTADMKQGFLHGLDDLSDTARDRIVALREQAYSARIRMENTARKGTQEAGHMIEDHPMAAGAFALGLGAAFAAALPRTEIENRSFGAESDRLMTQAREALQTESDRAARVARGVGDELKHQAREAYDDAAEKVADTADAVRVRARKEAAA